MVLFTALFNVLVLLLFGVPLADQIAYYNRGAAYAKNGWDIGYCAYIGLFVLLFAQNHRPLAYGFGRKYSPESSLDTDFM